MNEKHDDLKTTWGMAWGILDHCVRGPSPDRASSNKDGPRLFATLATVGIAGDAEARIVVLRRADRFVKEIDVYTDGASAKMDEIRAAPRGTLLVWAPAAAMQLRLKVEIAPRPGTPAEWAALPDPQRAAYGGSPPPGMTLDDPQSWTPSPEPNRFTILTCHLRSLETLHLCRDGHRRAQFVPATKWVGTWIAP